MILENLGNLFTFIGGLGLFLYGMNLMADGLQKSAGSKMKQLLGYLTNNRLLGVLMGALITAIIQSSSATTVMVVGFVNAGIINLTQAVGVIMGANIGTTATAWIVSASEWAAFLKPEFLAPLFIGIGAFLLIFTKSIKKHQIGEIIIGFGILFIGLSFMSDSVSVYKDSPIFAKAFSVLGSNPILGILVGTVVTAIIQSSSASVGILQTLAANGIVNWRSAIFITLGQNIGTCVTAIISSAGANKTAKRAAAIHLLFNVAGAVIFGVIMFVGFTIFPDWANANINKTEISVFHTIFNVTNTILLFPFASLLVKAATKLVKDKKEEEVEEGKDEIILKHLDERILLTPSLAVQTAVEEVVSMGEIVLNNVKDSMDLWYKETEVKEEEIQKILDTEKVINTLEKAITGYLVKISNLSITEEQQGTVHRLFYTISDLERIGDHAENIAEFAKERLANDFTFSEVGKVELKEIGQMAYDSVYNSILARKMEDVEYVKKVANLEDRIDNLEEELREKHIQRLSKMECNPESGVIFLDIISNLERISDHAKNIADNSVVKKA